jgi:effector-binding domain-containing protein
MKVVYNGEDGQVGSGYHWTGDEKIVGEGEMKNTGLSDSSMNFDIDIIKPWSMHMTGRFLVKDTNNMTKVSWSMTKHTAYPFNASNLVVDIDKYMGADFDLGLTKLKKLLEGGSATTAQAPIEITETDYPAHIYAGTRQVVSWDEMEQFFMENYGPLSKAIGANITGPPVSLSYQWDTTNKRADIMIAYPVRDSATKLKGITYTAVPASKAYMAVLKGGYSRLKEYHDALAKHVAAAGRQMLLPIEEYTVSMQQETDTNKLVTNVYYLVK